MDDIRYELVEIRTTSPVLFTDAGAAPPLVARAELYRPAEGVAPPYPAVVVSDARGELKEARLRPYARHLAEHGHAVLVVDSYAARRLGGTPQLQRLAAVTEAMMMADAFAAQAALAARDDIAPERIHHLGFAAGGLTALLSAFDQMRRTFGADGRPAFASHAAFYGSQALRLVDNRASGAPAAIFYGGQDDTLNHTRLDLLAGDLISAGAKVRIVGYDNACHGWDREADGRARESVNLRRLAGRIDPDGLLLDDESGRAILSGRQRVLWLARRASLFAVHKERNDEVTQAARAALLEHLAGGADGGGAADAAGERPRLRLVG